MNSKKWPESPRCAYYKSSWHLYPPQSEICHSRIMTRSCHILMQPKCLKELEQYPLLPNPPCHLPLKIDSPETGELPRNYVRSHNIFLEEKERVMTTRNCHANSVNLSIIKHLLSSYYTSGTVLNTGDAKKNGKQLLLSGSLCWRRNVREYVCRNVCMYIDTTSPKTTFHPSSAPRI